MLTRALALITLACSLLPAQSLSPGQFLRDFGQVQARTWTSPARAGQDLPILLPLAALTAALIATDHRTAAWAPERAVAPASVVSNVGVGYLVGAPGLRAGVGALTHDSKMRGTGVLAGLALANAEATTTALKYIFMRQRPPDGGEWFKPRVDPSFPSQHSAGVWAVSAVLAHEYPRARVPVYGIAAAVAISRFFAHRHHLSDILIGSVIGFGTGRMVAKEFPVR